MFLILFLYISVQLSGVTIQNSDGSVSWVDDNDPRNWGVTEIEISNALSQMDEKAQNQ